jgi:hypothetical protein
MNVKIKNDYQEDLSMGLIEHKQLFFMTATEEVTSSATDVISYDVPEGSELVLSHIDFSKGKDEAISVSITIDDVEKAAWTTMTAGEASLNGLKVSGGETVKVVGSGATTGDMSANLSGTLIKTNSVPVAITGFTASAGDSQITLSWTGQSESDDFKAFEIEWSSDGYGSGLYTLSDNTASSHILSGLQNGVEYSVSITWVGYDNGKSSPATATATPVAPPAPGDLPVVAALGNPLGTSSSSMAWTEDGGDTMTVVTIPDLTEFNVSKVATDGSKMIAAGAGNAGAALVDSLDGKTWTARSTVTENVNPYIWYLGGLWLQNDQSTSNLAWSDTGLDGSWTDVTNISSEASQIVYNGSVWVAISNETLYYSADGKTWTASTNGSTVLFDNVAAGNGFFVITGPDGAVASSSDGDTFTDRTSQVSGSDLLTYAGGDESGIVVLLNWDIQPQKMV